MRKDQKLSHFPDRTVSPAPLVTRIRHTRDAAAPSARIKTSSSRSYGPPRKPCFPGGRQDEIAKRGKDTVLRKFPRLHGLRPLFVCLTIMVGELAQTPQQQTPAAPAPQSPPSAQPAAPPAQSQ